jgi:hypothetical protein
MENNQQNVVLFLAYCFSGEKVPDNTLLPSPLEHRLKNIFDNLLPENIKLFYKFFEECVTFDRYNDKKIKMTKITLYKTINEKILTMKKEEPS